MVRPRSGNTISATARDVVFAVKVPCAASAASGACEVASATSGGVFFGNMPYSGVQTMITAQLSNGNGWEANAVVKQSGVFQEMAYCDVTDDNHCDFSMPVTLAPGSYTVELSFFNAPGTPSTSAVALAVN